MSVVLHEVFTTSVFNQRCCLRTERDTGEFHRAKPKDSGLESRRRGSGTLHARYLDV